MYIVGGVIYFKFKFMFFIVLGMGFILPRIPLRQKQFALGYRDSVPAWSYWFEALSVGKFPTKSAGLSTGIER